MIIKVFREFKLGKIKLSFFVQIVEILRALTVKWAEMWYDSLLVILFHIYIFDQLLLRNIFMTSSVHFTQYN